MAITLPKPEEQYSAVSKNAATVSNGSAAAAMLATGVGSCALGILAVVADGSKTIARLLTFYSPTGPLSGVTSVAIIIWLGAWFLLATFWRNKTVSIGKVNTAAFILLALALLLTFPPFSDVLLGK